VDVFGGADAVGGRRMEGGGRHQNGGEADQAVGKAATSCVSAVIWMRWAMKVPMAPPITMPRGCAVAEARPDAPTRSRGDHRDHHAGHAVEVAGARGCGRRQPFRAMMSRRRRRDREGRRGPGSRLCSRPPISLLLEHREHAVRDQEAAKMLTTPARWATKPMSRERQRAGAPGRDQRRPR